MIDWLWLIPTFVCAYCFGVGAGKRFASGAAAGIVGTLLTLIWIN